MISSSLDQPSVTPITMLAINVRVSPCKERYCVSSFRRDTFSTSPVWLSVMPSGITRLMVPFGPFTVATPSATVTLTPLAR